MVYNMPSIFKNKDEDQFYFLQLFIQHIEHIFLPAILNKKAENNVKENFIENL